MWFTSLNVINRTATSNTLEKLDGFSSFDLMNTEVTFKTRMKVRQPAPTSTYQVTAFLICLWAFSSQSSRYHISQSRRARELKFLQNVNPPQNVTRHMSCVMCHMTRVTCHVSHVKCHMSQFTCHVSHVTYDMSLFYIYFFKCWS